MLAACSIPFLRSAQRCRQPPRKCAPRPPRHRRAVAASSDEHIVVGWPAGELAGAGQSPVTAAAAAPSAAARSSGPFDGLPDELLGLILTACCNLGDREPSYLVAPQVCKRWHRVFHSNHCRTLWRELERKFEPFEDEPRAAAQLRVWRWVGPLAQRAAVTHVPALLGLLGSNCNLPDYLAALSAERLLSLRLSHVEVSAWALHMIGRFGRLRELDLRLNYQFIPAYEWALQLEADWQQAALLDTLSQLAELRRLHLEATEVDAALVAAISRLPRLQSLALLTMQEPLPDLSPLAALAGSLTALSLVEYSSSSTGLDLLLAAAFPRLEQLTVASPALQVPWCGTVEALHSDGGGDEPSGNLPYWAAAVQMWRTEAGVALLVQNARLDGEGAAAALLAAVTPAAASLETLWLKACSWSVESFGEGTPQLAAAQRLTVQGCMDDDRKDSLAPALGVLLQQTPHLCSLEVRCGSAADASLGAGCLRSGLPPEVASLRRLTSLVLHHTQLPHLDGVLEGLPGLAHLDLRGNRLRRLPAALACCAQLTSLLLGGNSRLARLAKLQVLASLPALKRLQLPWGTSEVAKAAVQKAAPRLEDVIVAPAELPDALPLPLLPA